MSDQPTTTPPARPDVEAIRARVEAATLEHHLCERCRGKGAHTHIGGACVFCPCQHPLDCRCGGCERAHEASQEVVRDTPALLAYLAHVEGLLAEAEPTIDHGAAGHRPTLCDCVRCRIRAALPRKA